MFDRFILAGSYSRLSKRFRNCHCRPTEPYVLSWNIAVGMKSYIMTNFQTKEFCLYRFGLSGIHEMQSGLIPFVRAEGYGNRNNNPGSASSEGVFLKPEFSRLIRYHRCLVLADAFIVGINHAPYLVHLDNNLRPFTFAGVWGKSKNEWKQDVYSFAVLTVPANKLLQNLGYTRMPAILNSQSEANWLNPTTGITDVFGMLNSFPYQLMNAYPISNKIADIKLNDSTLIRAVGESIFPKTSMKLFKSDLKKEVVTNHKILVELVDKIEICRN